MEKHTEDKTIIVCSYEANEPGDYVISVTWGDIEVRGSPFKVNLQKKKGDTMTHFSPHTLSLMFCLYYN